jgi:hypothetical protein
VTDPIKVGDVLPARLTADDMQRIFQIRRARFYRLAQLGHFKRFELDPPIGRLAYSGKLVMDYLNGDGRGMALVPSRKRA